MEDRSASPSLIDRAADAWLIEEPDSHWTTNNPTCANEFRGKAQTVVTPLYRSQGWRSMDTLPEEGCVLLGVAPDEGFPEGRVMIWNVALWRSGQNERTPRHLQYPADGWMPVPTAPEAAQ